MPFRDHLPVVGSPTERDGDAVESSGDGAVCPSCEEFVASIDGMAPYCRDCDLVLDAEGFGVGLTGFRPATHPESEATVVGDDPDA